MKGLLKNQHGNHRSTQQIGKKKNFKAKQKPKYQRTIKQVAKRQNSLVGCQSVTWS